jgi:hydrogenase-1 operon protein HyaF
MPASATQLLESIAVAVEHPSGNVEPLLHEIRHAVTRLLAAGTSTCIDLKSIPLAPGEEARIVRALGTGEVRAELAVLGRSELIETGCAGVWVVTHFDEGGAQQARFIEITAVPEILRSQQADIAAGLRRLTAQLAAPCTGER